MGKPDEPIRVAHVIGKLNAAGVEAVINNYYRHIDHAKYQFDYIIDSDGACQPPQDLIEMGARYYVVPPYQHLFKHIKALKKLFKTNQYKIVHSSMNTLAPISLYCAWRAGVPVRINHNHSTAGKGETKRNILKYILRPFAKVFATHYAACSKYAGEWLFGKKTYKQGKVSVFYNAIEVEKFHFDKKVRDQIRKDYNWEDKYIIGHVGRFCITKNQKFLISILREVLKKKPESVLILIGLGEMKEETERFTTDNKVSDKVCFLGARQDVEQFYQAMDVFVFPSRYEGLGLAAVEAQCSGLPVIASSSVPEEAKVSDRMFFIDLDDEDKWIKAIVNEKVEDRDIDIDQRYNITQASRKLETFYEMTKCRW